VAAATAEIVLREKITLGATEKKWRGTQIRRAQETGARYESGACFVKDENVCQKTVEGERFGLAK